MYYLNFIIFRIIVEDVNDEVFKFVGNYLLRNVYLVLYVDLVIVVELGGNF